MIKSVKSNELRIRLNGLDSVWAGAPVRREARPIAAKQFEGDDIIHGSKG